jgi:hypothetical protein
MLTDLIDDIQGVLFQHLDNISLVILCHTNKNYHQMISCYSKTNHLKRKYPRIAKHDYLEILKWARKNKNDNERLDVLKRATERDQDWNIRTYFFYGRPIEILKWIRENLF